jgi:hypothetical protein
VTNYVTCFARMANGKFSLCCSDIMVLLEKIRLVTTIGFKKEDGWLRVE